ncbi:uncharacterized protein N7482_003529 [Penicillium canariense]|uniref:Uncharacterized protein n=1 Tax=Penicillium canariense TaxID=189055 RepID=A0A9W9LPE3_9EURO|nr:uncharacterized protein N7482_003529 [Penicillium canariense]KAJ5167935.1 hypothetical protein N7482_003529 [Penicillium canariense]
MASLLRLPARLQARASAISLARSPFSLSAQRASARDSPRSSGSQEDAPRDTKSQGNGTPNHPIPSNKAQPTLSDGRQSPVADFEGNLKDNLPEDVKKHNEDLENRYDRPYNHVGDEGNVENTWKRK